jgi:hypothetical protein
MAADAAKKKRRARGFCRGLYMTLPHKARRPEFSTSGRRRQAWDLLPTRGRAGSEAPATQINVAGVK